MALYQEGLPRETPIRSSVMRCVTSLNLRTVRLQHSEKVTVRAPLVNQEHPIGNSLAHPMHTPLQSLT